MVILPAFGTTVELLEELVGRGPRSWTPRAAPSSTCGRTTYADEGYTAIIHGKYWHEETRYGISGTPRGGGAYLVVLDHAGRDGLRLHPQRRQWGRAPAAVRARRLARLRSGDPSAARRLRQPDDDAQLGVAGGEMFRQAMRDRYGDDQLPSIPRLRHHLQRHAGSPRTPVIALLAEQPIDLMVVIGGYNSSNTCNLARICAEKRPTYPIAGARTPNRHPRSVTSRSAESEITTTDWLPAETDIGPDVRRLDTDNIVESVIRRLDLLVNGEVLAPSLPLSSSSSLFLLPPVLPYLLAPTAATPTGPS